MTGKKHRGGSKIDLEDDEDVQRWIAKFGVTKEALEEAVREVGENESDVEHYFKSHPKAG